MHFACIFFVMKNIFCTTPFFTLPLLNFRCKMKRLLFVILLITISFLAKSKDYQAFKPVVDNINNLFSEIINARTDTDKEKINSELIGAVNDFLHKQGSFDHAIDTLKHLSCLKSSDNALRIYTWNLCYTDGSF